MYETIEEDLFDRTRRRVRKPLPLRERRVEELLSAVFLAAVALLWLAAPEGPAFDPARAAQLVVAYAVCQRARFWVGGVTTAPTQLVVVAMLVLAPTALVPVLVAGGLLLARAGEFLRGDKHPDRLLLLLPDALFSVPPALIVGVLGQPAIAEGDPIGDGTLLGIFALALIVQVGFDAGFGTLRERLIFGAQPSLDLPMFGRIAAADAALAPVGLVLALAARNHPLAIAAVLPLAVLLKVFAHDREQRLESAAELSQAYRGTAVLMNDLLEVGDAYTGGEHSRGVVELALDVGRRMQLGPATLRDLEFGALLHDIGKLRVPHEILHKPGKLTPEEWEVVKRHPADGQGLLDRVGGVLGEVGRLVRGHHESFDGRGYPDGLRGHDIPLGARIICACDAYNAMTTTRPYRAAMPPAEAVAELERCAGTQFDPIVVRELAAVVRAATRTGRFDHGPTPPAVPAGF